MRRLQLLTLLLSAALLGQILRTITNGATFTRGVAEGITTFLLFFSLTVRRQGLRLKDDLQIGVERNQ